MNTGTHDEGSKARSVRVFVSSTFRDMQAERDELGKFIFPQLRNLCEQRGVAWGEVDLRWGITDEQKEGGLVLPICLDEIQRCRPYFIGLLGERYGWIPDELPRDLVAREAWLEQHHEHSVTELEILHGVLNNPAMAGHAYFYFRSPAFIESLPSRERSAYQEGSTPEEIEKYGPTEAQRRAGERVQKLKALKKRIAASNLPIRLDYPTPQALGQLVLKDLTEVINQLYPEGSQPAALDREIQEHSAFARSRAAVYIGGERYFAQLDAHVQGGGAPLVVLGKSGSGKSALLANWGLQFQDNPAQTESAKTSLWSKVSGRTAGSTHIPLIMHFIGAAPNSSNWIMMLRHILGELQRSLGIEVEIPYQKEALRASFAARLKEAAARGRVVLIIDGLNQLEDIDQAPDLNWLPEQIPANVRLILSTLPGRSLEALKKRGWPVLQVEPLAQTERIQLIEGYLKQYTKSLGRERMERIAVAEQAANPLYLRTLLEELRLIGVHEKLDVQIGHYLEAGTPEELYKKVLKRYEQDYQRSCPGLVGEAMALLWAARHGLSETELLDLLGSDGQPLPRAHWSPLYLAAEASFVSRSGLLNFSHEYLRKAVEACYAAGETTQRAIHLRLADYFHGRKMGPRKLDEEPWQLSRATAWERLAALLGDHGFFMSADRANEYEVRGFWTQVEANSSLKMLDAYRPVLDDPGKYLPQLVSRLGLMFESTGHPAEALALQNSLAEHFGSTKDHASLSTVLSNKARLLLNQGDLHGAMVVNKQAEDMFRAAGNIRGIVISLGIQALALKTWGNLKGALALHKEEEALCRDLGDKKLLANCLHNQGNILLTLGDPKGALALFEQTGQLFLELGDKEGQAYSLGGRALVLQRRNDLDGAMALQKERERLYRETGNKADLAETLGNQGTILHERGDLARAIALYREQEQLFRELGDKKGLAASLGNQAVAMRDQKDLDGAMKLYKEQERIAREIDYKEGLSTSLNNQGNLLRARGNPEGAMVLFKKAEEMEREQGNKSGIANALANQAFILAKEMNKPFQALILLEEASRLAHSSGRAVQAQKIDEVRAYLMQQQRKR